MMTKQYCKVGATTEYNNPQSISILEFQYQNFVDKATNFKGTDNNLVKFFELKAQKIKKDLEILMQ